MWVMCKVAASSTQQSLTPMHDGSSASICGVATTRSDPVRNVATIIIVSLQTSPYLSA